MTSPDQHSPHTRLWRCPNCGQVLFSDPPPDMCAFCEDFTTWQLISGNGSPASNQDAAHDNAASTKIDDLDDSSAYQPPLFDE
jgi:hypothetical protein